jgi:hypothetical protein
MYYRKKDGTIVEGYTEKRVENSTIQDSNNCGNLPVWSIIVMSVLLFIIISLFIYSYMKRRRY